MRDFRQFVVWQRAHALALAAHALAARIPPRGFPGLASQLRRSSAAVPANIAEGCGHSSRREFARFLQLALASVVETDNHLQFALDLRAVDERALTVLLRDLTILRRMLATLLGRVREELNAE
jgi:four helix bundle protein